MKVSEKILYKLFQQFDETGGAGGTSLEDLGAATFKLINIVDHKVLTTSEVLQKSFESLLEVLQTSFRSPSLKFKALVQL